MTAPSEKLFPEQPGIIFMGTPDFAVPPLKSLVDNGFNISAVITQPDRPKGRGRKMSESPVKQLSLEHNIPVLQPEKVSDSRFCSLVSDYAPDLIIVVAFGQILKKELLLIPSWGVINIHASLLPRYRGAAPIQRSVLNNDSSTGLTIMHMNEGLDTGPVLYQEEVPILKDETAGQLHDRLSDKSGDMIVGFLNDSAGKRISERPQDDFMATYAHKIDKGLSRVDWEQDVMSISALIRGLDPFPGAFTHMGDKKIKLFSSRVIDEDRSGTVPGRVSGNDGERFIVEASRGALEIREIQAPGKKRMRAADFLRGFTVPEGTVLR